MNDEMVATGRQLYLLDDRDSKGEVIGKAHESKLMVHPGSTKMYRDLKEFYWWSNMKREIAEYVTKCGMYQQMKVEYQKHVGQLQPLVIPE